MDPESTLAYGDLPIPAYADLIWILLGLIIVWYGVWGHRRQTQNRNDFICPRCEKVYLTATNILQCRECNVPLEPLEGFYKRHPELKDK